MRIKVSLDFDLCATLRHTFLYFCYALSSYYLILVRKKYWPELDKYEDVLVVDGMITNKPGPYTIRLSISAPIDSAEFIPYPDCQTPYPR